MVLDFRPSRRTFPKARDSRGVEERNLGRDSSLLLFRSGKRAKEKLHQRCIGFTIDRKFFIPPWVVCTKDLKYYSFAYLKFAINIRNRCARESFFLPRCPSNTQRYFSMVEWFRIGERHISHCLVDLFSSVVIRPNSFLLRRISLTLVYLGVTSNIRMISEMRNFFSVSRAVKLEGRKRISRLFVL